MFIMKTRIQKLLVGAALVCAATLVQAQFFNITNNRDGTCTITRYVGPGGAVTIPNSISSLIVVSIGSDAFYGNSFLTNVTVPDSVTTIGYRAFGETGLTSVTIPNSVASIGSLAFSFCSSLTNVTIPDSVTNVGSGRF